MVKLTQSEIIELLSAYKNGDDSCLDTLLECFKPMVSSITRGYFLIGGDDEDLMQEGIIGLHKAIQKYNEDNNATFSTFAYLCILRQVQTAVRKSMKKSNATSSGCIPITDQGMIVLDETKHNGIYLISDEMTPEECIIEKERKQELSDIIKKQLSEFEYDVLELYLEGYSYKDISQLLQKDIKSVSNAVARIKMKLQDYFGGKDVFSIIS